MFMALPSLKLAVTDMALQAAGFCNLTHNTQPQWFPRRCSALSEPGAQNLTAKYK